MRPLIAHCHFGLGKLYRRTGQLDQAREHLTTATTMYREMDMRFWLEQVEAEMRKLEEGSPRAVQILALTLGLLTALLAAETFSGACQAICF